MANFFEHCLGDVVQLELVDPADGPQGWPKQIEANIEALLAKGPFRLAAKISEVYGPLIGVARSMHVRAAIAQLHSRPWGLGGGEPGATGENWLLRILTPGGGGWKAPPG